MAYICGMGMISPQNSLEGPFPFEALNRETIRLTCVEPEYKRLINPRHSRRMSRIIKMGVYAALSALEAAEIRIPDAIVTGTGLGCLQDTERFLNQIIENREQFLIPTSFIHSTHNTIGSQIALLLNCTGYNQTYTHGSISFESALLDGMLQLNDYPDRCVLVGGVDEMTDTAFHIKKRLGFWKRKPVRNLELFEEISKGTIAGEGAGFFCLSGTPRQDAIARIAAVQTFHAPASAREMEPVVESFLADHRKPGNQPDLVMTGMNGDIRTDPGFRAATRSVYSGRHLARYKHLCGEYDTSTAFALWLAANILRHRVVPESCRINFPPLSVVNTILIHNFRQDGTHSLILVEKR